MAIEKRCHIIFIRSIFTRSLLVLFASIAVNLFDNYALSQNNIINRYNALPASNNDSPLVYDNIKWANWGVGVTFSNGAGFARPEGVLCGTFLNDKRTVVIGEDHRIVVWNYENGSIVKVLQLSPEGTMAACLLPVDNLFATATGNVISIWNVRSLILQEKINERGTVCQMGFSKNGNYLFTVTDSAMSGRILRLWDNKRKYVVKDFKKNFRTIFSANISSDNHSLLIAGEPIDDPSSRGNNEMTLCFYDILTGNTIRHYLNETQTPVCACFSQDGRYFAAGFAYEEDNWGRVYNDTTLKVWDILSGKCVMAVADNSAGISHLSFSSSSDRIISITNDGVINIHRINSEEKILLQRDDAKTFGSIAVSSDGKLLLSGDSNTRSVIWDLDSSIVMRVLDPKHRVGHRANVWAVAYSRDGKLVASGDNSGDKSGGLKLWQASNGKLLRNIKSGTVSNLSFSPDGNMLASCYFRSEDVQIFNTKSGRLILNLPNHKGGATGCEFSADGRYIITAAYDTSVQLWDVATKKCVRLYEDATRYRYGKYFGMFNIAFGANDRFVIGSRGDIMNIWDMKSGMLISTFTDSSNGRSNIFEYRKVFSTKDGKTLFSFSLDISKICCRVWDIASGKLIRKFQTNSESAALSPDDKYIVTGSYDDRITRIWDWSTGKPIFEFSDYIDLPNAVSWSPDGRYIFSGTSGGTVIMWKVPPLVH